MPGVLWGECGFCMLVLELHLQLQARKTNEADIQPEIIGITEYLIIFGKLPPQNTPL